MTRPEKPQPVYPTVVAEPAEMEDVELYGEYVGRIRAQQFVEVRARVEGYLEEMLFEEGTYVKRNQVLFVINQDLYRAKADRVRAQLKKDEAQALKAKRDLDRIRPLYEQISSQIKAAIMSGELKAGEAIPSVRSLAKSLQISILTVQKAYATLQDDGFIETTAGKGCYVSAQNQDFYLEEQQKKIEEKFAEAIEIARTSGISLDKLTDLLTLMYQEDDGE